MGTSHWIDLLTLHEYQHVVQFQKAKTGITKFLYHLFGENGWAFATGLNLPHWYFEGDAVLAETLYSQSGRGRNPYFFAPQKALALGGVFYDYNKARNGSFKDLVPTVYPLGYTMMHYLHVHFSEKKDSILNNAHRYKFLFYPFSNAVKKYTGYSTKDLYEKSYEALKIKWQKELQNKKLSKTQNILTKKNKVVTDYTFAHFLDDGSLLAIKKSFTHTPQLVRIKNQQEKKLLSLDMAPQEFLSVQKNWVLWTALQRDLRYGNKNYSVLIKYNLKTKQKKQLTFKTHFYAPCLSEDGKKIICVNAQNNGIYRLNLLDANSGKLLKILKNPQEDFISLPKWKDARTVIYLAQRKQHIAFFSYDLKKDSSTQLSPWTRKSIGNYSIGKEYLYCSAGFEDTDGIYALHLKNKTFQRVALVKAGAYTPCVNKDESLCVFSEFTTMGQKLKSVQIHLKNEPATDVHKTIFSIQKNTPILDSISEKKYAIKPYKGVFKDFRIYNWGFQLDNTRPKIEDISLGLNAANALRDLALKGTVRYNTIEKTFSSVAKINYSKYFVQFGTSLFKNKRNYAKVYGTLYGKALDRFILLRNNFSQTGISMDFSLPLQRISGNYYQSLRLKNYYTYRFISPQTLTDIKGNSTDINELKNFASYGFKVSLRNIRRKARQNIASKFAQEITLHFEKSFKEKVAQRIAINAAFLLPGLFVNDSFSMYYFWKQQLHTSEYLYLDPVAYARGYRALVNESLQTFSLNYGLPISYPDFGFAGIFYIKRLHANLFYDHTILEGDFYKKDFDNTFNSVGIEEFLDVNFLNILPVTLGLRQSFKLRKDIAEKTPYSWNFLMRLRL